MRTDASPPSPQEPALHAGIFQRSSRTVRTHHRGRGHASLFRKGRGIPGESPAGRLPVPRTTTRPGDGTRTRDKQRISSRTTTRGGRGAHQQQLSQPNANRYHPLNPNCLIDSSFPNVNFCLPPTNGSETVPEFPHTRQKTRHQQWLARLRNATTAPEIIHIFRTMATDRNWLPSTTLTEWGTLRGALSRAKQYHLPLLQEIATATPLRDFGKTLQIKEAEAFDPTRQTLPLTYQHLLYAQEALIPNPDARVAILLTWAFAGRLADILKLQTQHIELTKTQLKARFVIGKSVRLTHRPYTVQTTTGPWTTLLATWIRNRGPYLFPEQCRERIHKQVTKTLRNINPKYTVHSIRKGAICHLTSHGASIDEVMKFTRHATEAMCLRYLAWGWYDHASHNQTSNISQGLWTQ